MRLENSATLRSPKHNEDADFTIFDGLGGVPGPSAITESMPIVSTVIMEPKTYVMMNDQDCAPRPTPQLHMTHRLTY